MRCLTVWAACLLLVISVAKDAGADKQSITDVAGRTVTVDVPVRKIILGEGRFLPSLAILDRVDPVKWVAAIMGDLKRFDPTTFAAYAEKFPALLDVPEVGANGAASFSSEHAIGVRPDVAVFGLGSSHGPAEHNKEILARLDAAGIPVVVVDFRREPLINTPKSIELLGKLMGKEAEAAAFNDYYRKNLEIVSERLKGLEHRPSVFMEMRVGLRDVCCETTGAQMLGRFIEWSGGENIVAKKIPGTHGVVNPEFLIAKQPDIYLATAIGSYPPADTGSNRVILGAGAPPDVAAASLRRAVDRPVVSDLKAVSEGRAFAIWHHFYNTPMSVAAVQAMAKWFHPEVFADLDPHATLAAYFDRFQPLPLDGVYWTGLKSE